MGALSGPGGVFYSLIKRGYCRPPGGELWGGGGGAGREIWYSCQQTRPAGQGDGKGSIDFRRNEELKRKTGRPIAVAKKRTRHCSGIMFGRGPTQRGLGKRIDGQKKKGEQGEVPGGRGKTPWGGRGCGVCTGRMGGGVRSRTCQRHIRPVKGVDSCMKSGRLRGGGGGGGQGGLFDARKTGRGSNSVKQRGGWPEHESFPRFMGEGPGNQQGVEKKRHGPVT